MAVNIVLIFMLEVFFVAKAVNNLLIFIDLTVKHVFLTSPSARLLLLFKQHLERGRYYMPHWVVFAQCVYADEYIKRISIS